MIKGVNIELNKSSISGKIARIERLNFHIENGEFVALVSNIETINTDLIKTLGLLLPLEKGELYVHDTNVTELTNKERNVFRTNHIGILFSNSLLIDELTVYENVELPLIYLRMDGFSRKRRIETTLAQLNLSHRKNNYPGQLSADLLKHVELARALVIQPKIMLIDQPTSNLSIAGADNFMRKLAEINSLGVTVIITSDEDKENKITHRSIFLDKNRVMTL